MDIDVIEENCFEDREELNDLITDRTLATEQKLEALLEMQKARTERGLHSPGEDMAEAYEDLLQHRKGNELPSGISTGLKDVDRLTRGFCPGKLYILGAPPAMGKTSMALQFAIHAGLSGETVAFFNMDMEANPFVLRLLSSASGIPLAKDGTIQPVGEEWDAVKKTTELMQAGKIQIDHTESYSVEEIFLQCEKVKELGIVFIDRLQMIKRDGSDKYQSKIAGDFSDVCRKLKNMAELLDVPVVCLSSMPVPTYRKNRRPCLSDFDIFGAIDRYADAVIGIYREAYYSDKEEFCREAEVIVMKSTMHITGRVYVRWNPELLRFEDLD